MVIEIVDIPKWIKAERQRQGISVVEMAEKTYSGIGAIYDIESDRRKKSVLPRMALDVLNILGYEVQINLIKKQESNIEEDKE